jgi:signal transduction histidine kinase
MTSTVRTILYIEDDPSSRRLIERLLTHAGYQVLLAERGLDGIDIARSKRPDLILTDINLPDLSGNDIATALRNEVNFHDTPIVALTAQGQAGMLTALATGITGFLTKPIDIETFIDKVEFYLGGGHDATADSKTLYEAHINYTRDVVARLEKRIRSLESTNEALKRLDKMKETFIQLAAHELRTPLTLLFGYTRLLEDHADIKALIERDPYIEELFTGFNDSVIRMQGMVEEILTMSRILTNQIDLALSPINLATLAQNTLRLFTNALTDRHLTIHFESEHWPKQMQGDSGLIQIVLNNLVSNAIKYTPDGGHIYLEASKDERQVRFSVRDTGVGIDPEDREKIFEQFHTLSDTQLHSTSKTAYMGGGLGLGLPIVRGIVKAHEGDIVVESSAHDPKTLPGTCFIVTLPAIIQRKVKPTM